MALLLKEKGGEDKKRNSLVGRNNTLTYLEEKSNKKLDLLRIGTVKEKGLQIINS